MKYYILILFFLLYACSQAGQGDLLEIPVDINQDISLPLSEITEEMTVIELEMTSESLINTDRISRIIISENHIITVESTLGGTGMTIVFNKDGKFIRTIGSRGQGPGEFNLIQTATFDAQSNRLFIVSAQPNKIICYDLNGKFIKESRLNSNGDFRDINYINGELFLDGSLMQKIEDIYTLKRILYRMNEDFQITDSCIARENYSERGVSIAGSYIGHFNNIIKNNTSVYFYAPEIYIKSHAPQIKVLRDTLYRWEDNRLVPELKLRFRNEGFDSAGDKIIDLNNIYRSSRYVFAIYAFNPGNKLRTIEFPVRSHFCYDTKTGKGYSMLEGYTDDINGIEKRVDIRPLNTDSETFYYWYTHMKPGDHEEPNPTLYIIKLRK